MNQTPGTPKEQVRAMRIFFTALLSGSAIFLIVSLFINQFRGGVIDEWPKYRTAVLALVLGLSFIVLILAKRNFNRRITSAKDSLNPLREKLNAYTQALILYAASCETPVLLNIILFIVTGDFAFIAYASVLIGFLLSAAPTKRRISEGLNLNSQEEREIE